MTKILYKIYGGVLSYLIQYMVGICLNGVRISLCMPYGSNILLQIIKKVTYKNLSIVKKLPLYITNNTVHTRIHC